MAEKKYLIDNAKLMAEWAWDRNLSITPSQLTLGSDIKAWWKCSKGHEWQALIHNRVKGRGCPYCSNRKLLQGYNDLQTINPALVNEWNYEKNNGLIPADVSPRSDRKVWWKCFNGHEWQATIGSRNRGSGCPTCRKRKTNTSD